MIDRWQEEQKRQDLRFGILAAALTGTKEHPRKASDFFSSLKAPATESDFDEKALLLAKALGWKGTKLKRKKAKK